MERSRMAVLRIAFALAAVSPIVSAQAPAAAITQAGTPVDSSVKATPVAEPVPNFFKDVQANAFASFGNNFNFNRPASRLNALRVFDANANSFQVDIAELVLQKPIAKVGDVGFRVDLVTGSAIPVKTQATGLAIGTGADLQQALLSYIAPLGSGLRLDFGKFVTIHGIEVIEGYDGYNDNYSRSLLFNYAIPFTHTGAIATYTFSSQVTAEVMVVNGWDNAVDNNSGKTVGIQLALTPVAPLSVLLHYMGGPEADSSSAVRHLGDIVATYKVSDMLSLGINGDYAVERRASAVIPGADARWNGVAGYVKISPAPKYFVALRVETMRDEGGTRFGLGRNTTANEFTVTPTLKVTNNFVVRAEGRYDAINQDNVFLDDKGKSRRNQKTLGLNAMFVY